MKEWTNWSGSLRFTPAKYVTPKRGSDLRKLILAHRKTGTRIKLAAAGHSSSPLVKTTDTLVNLKHFKGIVRHDTEEATVTLGAGMSVHECNMALQDIGLALFNTGDVDVQTLAGAISTGTHGSGRGLQNLASVLQGVRLVNARGEVMEYDEKRHPDVMKAMRVSLGVFGIFTELTVKVVPLFRMRRLEICTTTDDCVRHFDELADQNRNLDFYWYPRSDDAKIRILNEPGEGTSTFSFPYKCKEDDEDFVGKVLPKHRELRFDEMEYALPREAGLACFEAVRNRIRERHRKEVAWRVLVRSIAKDDFYLSPHHGRESISISLHHNAGLPFGAFFSDLEPVFIDYGGRPHWAKIHHMKAAQLRPLYPMWDRFQMIRQAIDPEDFFMNDYLKQLFDDDAK
jgi:FAD/FMN-containing dehydrogenase